MPIVTGAPIFSPPRRAVLAPVLFSGVTKSIRLGAIRALGNVDGRRVAPAGSDGLLALAGVPDVVGEKGAAVMRLPWAPRSRLPISSC